MIEPYSKVEIPLSEYKKLIVLEDRSEREKTSLYKTCMEDCRKKLDNKLNDLQSIIDSNLRYIKELTDKNTKLNKYLNYYKLITEKYEKFNHKDYKNKVRYLVGKRICYNNEDCAVDLLSLLFQKIENNINIEFNKHKSINKT